MFIQQLAGRKKWFARPLRAAMQAALPVEAKGRKTGLLFFNE